MFAPGTSCLIPRPYPGSRRSQGAVRTTCSATTVQVATPVAATTPRRTPLSSPALLPVPGGAPGPAYGAPLRGSPEPLGASYDKELVRGWGARFAPLAANGAAEQIASRRCN